jgi:hypothetical protein
MLQRCLLCRTASPPLLPRAERVAGRGRCFSKLIGNWIRGETPHPRPLPAASRREGRKAAYNSFNYVGFAVVRSTYERSNWSRKTANGARHGTERLMQFVLC